MTLFPIPPTAIVKLKGMTLQDASSFLDTFPDLSMEDRERLLKLAVVAEPPSVPTQQPAPSDDVEIRIHDPRRRLFMAAAWIAGASFNQIGSLFGIARQSAQQQVDRILTSQDRARLVNERPARLQWELLEVMRRLFFDDSGKYPSDPRDLANLLVEEARDAL